MDKQENNYAFIDEQNLYCCMKKKLGWNLDTKKFRIYLRDKYSVQRAYMFIGKMDIHANLYTKLQSDGFILVFKPILKYKDGTIKANCDADLVLQAMIDFKEYDRAVIVSEDGDFYSLVQYLKSKDKLKCLLVPDENSYSSLLKKPAAGHLASMNSLRKKLEYIKRAP